MKTKEFNEKWSHRLEEGHYGCAISDEKIISHIDETFTEWEKNYPKFTYSQIKWKFNSLRIYADIPDPELRMLYLELEQNVI